MADARVVGGIRARPLLHDRAEGGGVSVPVRRAADQQILAPAGQEQIAAQAADQQVAAPAAEQEVVAGAAEQGVVAAASLEDVVARAAVQPGRLMDLFRYPEE